MDNLLPTISTVIASSTSNMATFFSFVWPIIPFFFAIIVIGAIFQFIVNFIHYVAEKIEDKMDPQGAARFNMRADIMDDLQNEHDWMLWKRWNEVKGNRLEK